MRRIIFIALVAVGLVSCEGTNQTTTDNKKTTERKKMACAKVHVDMDKPHIDWFEEKSTVLFNTKEVLVLPQQYKVYSVDRTKMSEFFKSVQDNNVESTVLPLPKPAECQVFTVKNKQEEGTVIPNGTVLALGTCKEQVAVIKYFNDQMVAMVRWFDLMYEIKPVIANDKTYYIVYAKEPPRKKTEEEKALERPPKMVEYKPVK